MNSEQEPNRLGNLGSLAQSARLKHLNQARWIMIIVGVLTIGLNVFLLVTLKEQLRNAPRQLFDQLYTVNTVIASVGIGLGAIFIVLGILVKTFPVTCTVTGLVLYVAGHIFFFAISGDPATLYYGVLIKIVIIIAMAKSIQAAFAYQKEKQEEALARGSSGRDSFGRDDYE